MITSVAIVNTERCSTVAFGLDVILLNPLVTVDRVAWTANNRTVRHLIGILLSLLFLSTGTGLFEHVHLADHMHGHSAADWDETAEQGTVFETSHTLIDVDSSHSECVLCSLLHAPIISPVLSAIDVRAMDVVTCAAPFLESRLGVAAVLSAACRDPPALH